MKAQVTEKRVKQRATGLPRLGKPKLPEERRRVFLSVRVLPDTLEFLKSMGESNPGRAVDALVSAVKASRSIPTRPHSPAVPVVLI